MVPRISVKVKGQWVPIDTLSEEQQIEIRKRVGEVLQNAIKQQISILLDKPQAVNN